MTKLPEEAPERTSAGETRRQRRLAAAIVCTALLTGCSGPGSGLGYSYHLGSDTFDAVDPAETYAVGLGVLTVERGEAELVSARYTQNTGLAYSVKLVHLTGKQQIVGGGAVAGMIEPGNVPVAVPGFHLRVKESDTWELVAFVRLTDSGDATIDGGTLAYRDGSGRHTLKLAGPIRLRRGSGPL